MSASRGLFFGLTAFTRLTCQSRSDIPLRKGVAFADPTKCDAPGAARLAADGRRTVAEPDRDDRQPPRIDLARSPNAKSWLSAMSGCSPIGTVSKCRRSSNISQRVLRLAASSSFRTDGVLDPQSRSRGPRLRSTSGHDTTLQKEGRHPSRRLLRPKRRTHCTRLNRTGRPQE
jgi:hypothetical protein